MSPLLPSALSNPRSQPLLLAQSSAAQSCLPVLRHIVGHSGEKTVLLFCLLYPPSAFASKAHLAAENIRLFDWTAKVPGYGDDQWDLKSELLQAVDASPPARPLIVVVDGVDTLLSDLGSLAQAEHLLAAALSAIRARNDSSRLVLHAFAPSPLIPLLSQTRFSPTLTHLIAHPPALLTHLATAYLTPPPPLSSPEKFWGVFLPIAERHYESERLVFGAGGEGSSSGECVVEVLVRGPDASGRRRSVDRVLEGWSVEKGGAPCSLQDLESLKVLWTRKVVAENSPDPTQNLSFNLNLTPQQQQSRAQVPLPYAHEGDNASGNPPPSTILYDPDSADDLDDDDPDEDLDI